MPVQHRGGDIPRWFIPSHEPPANSSRPAMTSGRSGQCRAGGGPGRSIISSRLAPITSGQSCSGRRSITSVHIFLKYAACSPIPHTRSLFIHPIQRRGIEAVLWSRQAPYQCRIGTQDKTCTMTTFDEREKDFEARFKHDQELQFKVKARRNRLLGLWAAERMGLSGDAAQAYAKEVVEAAVPPRRRPARRRQAGRRSRRQRSAASPRPASPSSSSTSPSRPSSS